MKSPNWAVGIVRVAPLLQFAVLRPKFRSPSGFATVRFQKWTQKRYQMNRIELLKAIVSRAIDLYTSCHEQLNMRARECCAMIWARKEPAKSMPPKCRRSFYTIRKPSLANMLAVPGSSAASATSRSATGLSTDLVSARCTRCSVRRQRSVHCDESGTSLLAVCLYPDAVSREFSTDRPVGRRAAQTSPAKRGRQSPRSGSARCRIRRPMIRCSRPRQTARH